MYNDPFDYAPFGTSPDQVYDQKWYMPPSGTQRGTAYTGDGDPLTPAYPSTGLRMSYYWKIESSMIVSYRLHVSSGRGHSPILTENSGSTHWLR